MTLLSLQPVIWLAITLIAIFCEAIFANLIYVWCAPAALIALICGFFGIPVYIQSIVFAVSAVVMIVIAQLFRKFANRSEDSKISDESLNSDVGGIKNEH